jgi:hypothetical protein
MRIDAHQHPWETLPADLSPDENTAIFGGNVAHIYLSSRRRRPR